MPHIDFDSVQDARTTAQSERTPDVALQQVASMPRPDVGAVRRARNWSQTLGKLSGSSTHLPARKEVVSFDSVRRDVGTFCQAKEWSAPHREGSRDFLKAPSVIGSQLVYRKEQQ